MPLLLLFSLISGAIYDGQSFPVPTNNSHSKRKRKNRLALRNTARQQTLHRTLFTPLFQTKSPTQTHTHTQTQTHARCTDRLCLLLFACLFPFLLLPPFCSSLFFLQLVSVVAVWFVFVLHTHKRQGGGGAIVDIDSSPRFL